MSDLPDLELNTVDAFQGREKDVVIFSCVRASDQGIGFLSDTRRMNVAITRGKYGCFVVGKQSTLQDNRFWNLLLSHAKDTNSLMSIKNSSENLDHALSLVVTSMEEKTRGDASSKMMSKDATALKESELAPPKLRSDKNYISTADEELEEGELEGDDYYKGEIYNNSEVTEVCDFEEIIDSDNNVHGRMFV